MVDSMDLSGKQRTCRQHKNRRKMGSHQGIILNRFSSVVDDLRLERAKLLEESKKKRRKKGAPRRKVMRKIEFESPMLEKIFNEMPKDMQEMLRRKV